MLTLNIQQEIADQVSSEIDSEQELQNGEVEEEEGNFPLPAESTPLLPININQNLSSRVSGFDLFRGLIMIFESIDHSREFLSKIKVQHEEWYHMPNFYDITKNEGMPILAWFLRALTALCAPGFMFLMGLGIVYFAESRKNIGWTNVMIYKHFALRGAVLVFLNFFHFPFLMLMLGKFKIVLTVLYALGINIFLGSFILSLEVLLTGLFTNILEKQVKYEPNSAKLIGFTISFSIFITACFTLTTFITMYHDKIQIPQDIRTYTPGDFMLMVLIPCSRCDSLVFSIYPFIPWLTPVIWGLLFGRIYTHFKLKLKLKILMNLVSGVLLLVFFLALRFGNGFGNIHNEILQPPPLESFINFLNLTKYPPSLSYFCWTIGCNHILMAICLAYPTPSTKNPILVFGKSALFFYVMHFYIYGIGRFVLYLVHNSDQTLSISSYISTWIGGLICLYPLCYYYSIFKSKKGPDSIWRFF